MVFHLSKYLLFGLVGSLFVAVPRQVFCDSSESEEGESIEYSCESGTACYKRSGDEGEFDLVVWLQDAGDAVTINMTSSVGDGSDERWVAIAFSSDQLMGDDDVIMCLQNNDQVSVVRRWNEGRTNIAADNETYGIQDEVTSVENGVVSCSFSRTKMIDGDSQAFNLNEEVYLLFGEGPMNSGTPTEHSQNPEGSDNMVNVATATGVIVSSDHHEGSSSEEDGADDSTRIMASWMVISAAIMASLIYHNYQD